jgi:3-oxoacyl-[acyl-carrier protein] reductase
MSDRVAVITGAGKGIGRATALKLASKGINLALLTRTRSDFDSLTPELDKSAVEYLTYTGDVSQEADILAFADKIEDKYSGVDYLINNAGVFAKTEISEAEVEEFDRVMAVNVRGAFLMTKAFAKGMIKRGDGVILFVSSIAGLTGFKGGLIYSASKHAIQGMAESLMFELRDQGVRIATICPGNVNTPMWDRGSGKKPIPETMIQPEEVAESIYYACTMPNNTLVKQIELRSTNTRFPED